MTTKSLFVLALLGAMFSTLAVSAEDRDVLRHTDIRPGDLSGNVNVNPQSQRRYVGYTWEAEKSQKIELTVWSHDHQPEILVFFTDPTTGKATGKRIGSSVSEQKYVDENGRLVYYSTLTFVAPRDAKYKVILTHAEGATPGGYWTEGTVWSKPKASAVEGDLAPQIAGYQGKVYGDPDEPSGPRGWTTLGVNYGTASRDRVGEIHGLFVKPEDVDKAGPNWDRDADGRQIPPGVTVDRDRGIVTIGSESKRARVAVVIWRTFPQLEPQLVEAGKRMLAAMEEVAADR
jgi:hypothetical protein